MLKGRICKLDIGVTITLSELHISSCVTANRLFEDALAKLRLLDIEFLFTGQVDNIQHEGFSELLLDFNTYGLQLNFPQTLFQMNSLNPGFIQVVNRFDIAQLLFTLNNGNKSCGSTAYAVLEQDDGHARDEENRR
ncbi:hypothetical protein T4B_9501 [Trichinella pseudospiralis]|uniref:Uncharacterized protein n=1 Tax=Trichinella pseudospiralis TaxID=6337 RepID=A0A0V1HIJ1_TRIPS|nr:hypothetical protein T4B_9501 [Trichinella pseudospiralis]KRZ26814.1 hypothetical protein T4C_5924 [Trichinella pseudospiralis]